MKATLKTIYDMLILEIKTKTPLCLLSEQTLSTEKIKALVKSLKNKSLGTQQQAYNTQKLVGHYKSTNNPKFADYYRKHFERLTNSGRANKDFAIGKFFLNLSNAAHKKTGIRIMDPSAVKNPPKWAKQNPVLWAAMQTIADFTLSDPFTAAIAFVPVGKLGSAGAKALTKVAGKQAGQFAKMSVKDAVVKLGPEKGAEFVRFLNNTETKQFAKAWWQEFSKVPPAAANKHMSVVYGGVDLGRGIDELAAAAKRAYQSSTGQVAATAAMTKIESQWLRYVSNNIQNGKIVATFSDDGVRPMIVVETASGPKVFYRSSGQSTPGQKKFGDWVPFDGMRNSREGYIFYQKTSGNIQATRTVGSEDYHIAKALSRLWDNGWVGKTMQRVKIDVGSAKTWAREANKKLQKLDPDGTKYLRYNGETMWAALINKQLQSLGVGRGNAFGQFREISGKFLVGLQNVPSEALTRFSVQEKILPSLHSLGL